MTERKPVGGYPLQTSAGALDYDHRYDEERETGQGTQTYAQYAQQTCMSSRHRLKLIAQGVRERIHHAPGSQGGIVRQGLRRIGAHVGMAASRKRHRLADRIERKAVAIRSKTS